MIRTIALSIGLGLTVATMAMAQQSPTASTPGVLPGTTGTTFGTPGAMQMPGIPGGGIPQAAGTQDQSLTPPSGRNYNNSSVNSLDNDSSSSRNPYSSRPPR